MTGTSEKKGSKRKSPETVESTDEFSTGNQRDSDHINVEDETTVLKSMAESATVDETWNQERKPNSRVIQDHEDKWRQIIQQNKTLWAEIHSKEMCLRMIEGKLDSNPENNGMLEYCESEDWFARKHVPAMNELEEEYRNSPTTSKNAQRRVRCLHEAIIPMQEQIAAAIRRVGDLETSTFKDVKESQQRKRTCEGILNAEEDEEAREDLRDWGRCRNLNSLLASNGAKSGPFSSPSSTNTGLPGGILTRNQEEFTPRTPASTGAGGDFGRPSTMLTQAFELKPLYKVDSESVDRFINAASSIAGSLSGLEFLQWISEEAREALDSMGMFKPLFANWRKLDKHELCKLLKEGIVKEGENKYVHSLDEMFEPVTITMDAKNLTAHGLAAAFAGLKDQLKRFSMEIAKAEGNPKVWRALSALLLRLFEVGHAKKGEVTGPNRDKLAETKELRRVVAAAIRQRCNADASDPRCIKTCEDLWVNLGKDVLAHKEAFAAREAVFMEMADTMRAAKKPRTEAAPKGGLGQGVSAGLRVHCTCGRMHAMPCREGGKAVQGGAPTYAQQTAWGKGAPKPDAKPEYKPKPAALRAFTADDVLDQLDVETRRKVTQQLDQRANGGSGPKGQKPKGQSKGKYDANTYKPKGKQ